MVEDVADRTLVSVDFPAVVAVATLAGLCGRRAMSQPKERDTSWVVVPNLWGAIVADPGMMKSPTIAAVTAAAKSIEADWRAEYGNAMRKYESDEEVAKLDSAVWAESYKRAKKKKAALPEKPECGLEPPQQRRLIAVDATFEKLHEILGENPAGGLLLRDELSGWLASMERQGRESERAFMLECWKRGHRLYR
jgi:putative DNA primase/helicase